jgi:predicted GTPase
MGYGAAQVDDLRATLDAVEADIVLSATPIDLDRLLGLDKPVTRVAYDLVPVEGRPLSEVIEPIVAMARVPAAVGG